MNTAANLYDKKCENIRESHNSLIQTVISETVNVGNQQESTEDRTGWALKYRKKVTRFSQRVRDYLYKICEECDRTGRKEALTVSLCQRN